MTAMGFKWAMFVGLALFLSTLPVSPATNRAAEPVEVRMTPEGFEFIEAGAVIAAYQSKPTEKDGKFQRSHYLHPVLGLDGEPLTEDFPADHLHHRGIFWAWHQVHVDDKPLGDAWVCQRFHWNLVSAEIKTLEESAQLNLVVHWSSDDLTDEAGKRIPVVREEATITVHRRTADYRLIDISFTLKPLMKRVSIGGSEDAKGYGGFSVRMKMRKPMQFLSPTGEVEPTRLAISAGKWLDVRGPIGKDQQLAGVAMIQRPGTTGAPQPWILRRSGSMQNAAFPGRHAVELSEKEPLQFHYRLVIHAGKVDKAKLDELAK
jgi:hypothetical protein